MKAILPAAGYATRMYPLTKDRPKALLPLGDRPVIEYILDRVQALDAVDQAIVVTNERFFPAFSTWAESYAGRLPVSVLHDGTSSNETRLGTLGDLQLVIDRREIDDDLLVVNADNLFSFDLTEAYATFRTHGEALLPVYDFATRELASHRGVVVLDDDDKVIDFQEKPADPPTTICSVGMYLFPAATLSLLRTYLDAGNPPDRSGDFIHWLHARHPVYAHVFGGDDSWFYDIGSLDSYEDAKKFIATLSSPS